MKTERVSRAGAGRSPRRAAASPTVDELLASPRIVTTDGTVCGTPAYIAPECLLAAGWTLEQLRRADERVGDMGWDVESVQSEWLES